MYRSAMEQLIQWKNSHVRRPLIIEGVRRSGKTWLMKEFGRTEYKSTVYIDCASDDVLSDLFSGGLSAERLIHALELYSGKVIDPDSTLILFDEIQEAPHALESLKIFCEQAPQLHLLCSCSFPGAALNRETSFPIGKVSHLRLLPLSFREFLQATDNEGFAKLLDTKDLRMVSVLRQKFTELLKIYLTVGGMPEAVAAYCKKKDLPSVRKVQKSIIDSWRQDFSTRPAGSLSRKILTVWDSLPQQLDKESKKFIYRIIGGRSKEFSSAIPWLCDCGYTLRVPRITLPEKPLREHEDSKAFRLFAADVGLLGCLLSLPPETALSGKDIFGMYNGALTEQFAVQELTAARDMNLFYYTNARGACEISLILDTGGKIFPVEVQGEENLQSKILRTYTARFSPEITVRLSLSDFRKDGSFFNFPLYTAGLLHEE